MFETRSDENVCHVFSRQGFECGCIKLLLSSGTPFLLKPNFVGPLQIILIRSVIKTLAHDFQRNIHPLKITMYLQKSNIVIRRIRYR